VNRHPTSRKPSLSHSIYHKILISRAFGSHFLQRPSVASYFHVLAAHHDSRGRAPGRDLLHHPGCHCMSGQIDEEMSGPRRGRCRAGGLHWNYDGPYDASRDHQRRCLGGCLDQLPRHCNYYCCTKDPKQRCDCSSEPGDYRRSLFLG
jgi:hypothetical protein